MYIYTNPTHPRKRTHPPFGVNIAYNYILASTKRLSKRSNYFGYELHLEFTYKMFTLNKHTFNTIQEWPMN